MRPVELFQALAPIPMAIALGLLASRRRVIRAFERAEALHPSRAIAPPSYRLLGNWWLRRLLAAGVLQESPAGRWWLHEETWRAYRSVRRRRGLTLVAIALTLLALLVISGALRPGQVAR
jgi:hypothetical protein